MLIKIKTNKNALLRKCSNKTMWKVWENEDIELVVICKECGKPEVFTEIVDYIDYYCEKCLQKFYEEDNK